MVSKSFIDVLERAKSWPREEQEELAAYAREIESRHVEPYVLTADEEVAIDEGLAQLDRGEFVTEQQMERVWKRYGAK